MAASDPICTQEVYSMTQKDLGTLNSLVTYAMENIPGGPNQDETAVARMVGIWCIDGVPVTQVCPHCDSPAPAGPDRIAWLERHIDDSPHRVWWGVKNRVSDFRARFAR